MYHLAEICMQLVSTRKFSEDAARIVLFPVHLI